MMRVGEKVRCEPCDLDIWECIHERLDDDQPHCSDFKGCGDIPSPGYTTPIQCPKCLVPLEIK